MRKSAIIFGLIFFSILGGAMKVTADNGSATGAAQTVGRTPPRLSFLDGDVSFWRPGAQDWSQAQINTALAPGDQLYIEGSGNLELQVGAQAYVRGGKNAQIGLVTQEPDFLRFKVTDGRVAFDLRTMAPGRTVEVDTPHGAFTISHAGYYRLEVSDARTTFTTRRDGRASVAAAEGAAVPMRPDESVVIEGPSEDALAFQAAAPMDAWDTWNYDRTDALLEAGSSRYLAPDTYGAEDLDRYGSWRVLPTYGPVWIPAGVPPGWAPYSTGSWMHDPYYGWTWVDTAPWGWAPYHYGRWVYVNSYWCWAPGPAVHRAVYAPALVAFFGGPGVSVGISVGGPGVGWVALGWGEPLIPWWGRTGFIHRPWWGGWGGPHCINGRVIHRRTVVRINEIHHYRNFRIHHALVVVDRGRFGHGRIHRRDIHTTHVKNWRPIHRAPDIHPGAASYAPSTHRGRRPSERTLRRATVTFGPQRAHRPAVTRRRGDVREWSTRSNRGRQPDSGHVRPRTVHPSRTLETRSVRPARPRPERPSAAMGSRTNRRPEVSRHRQAPARNRPPAVHPHPRTWKPEADVRPQRRSRGPAGSARTTQNDTRSRSVERPSHFQRLPQTTERRTATPAPRPPAARPRVERGQRIENHRATSRPEVRQGRSQPQKSPAVERPARNESDHRGEGGFRSTPRGRERGWDNNGGRGNWRPQMNRSPHGESGQRFNRRFRN